MIKHAFLILAHKNPAQLQLLVDYLHKNDCELFIHIDSKSKSEFADFIQRNRLLNGVNIYSEFKVYWGSYNQIRATFFLLEKAVASERADFITLISAQDLPIKPITAFSQFLSSQRDKSFLQFHTLPAEGNWAGNGGLDRLRLFWITHFPQVTGFFINRLLVVIHRTQNFLKWYKKWEIPLFGGANWFTLNREMALYTSDYIKNNPDFLLRFKNTRCADEIILQTILLNSEHKSKIVDTALRFVDWSTGPEYPRIFRTGDFDRLMQCDEFFARKFDESLDKEIIHKIYSAI